MDLNNKNGQPSMEEILASIRRIIAEEPTAANPVIDLHARYRTQKVDDHDESNDFELPSIFRPAAPAPERQPLFGRLTDAIRNASGNNDGKAPRKAEETAEPQERYRGALRDAGNILALSNGQGGLEGSTNGTHHSTSGESADRYRGALRDSGSNASLSSALSSLKLTRGTESSPLPERVEAEVAPAPVALEPSPVSLVAPAAAPSPAPLSASAEDIRRVMVPFRDMRMSRMSTGPAAATPEASALEAFLQAGSPVFTEPPVVANDFPAPPVHDLTPAFQPSLPPVPAPPAYDEGLSLDDMHRFASTVEQPAPRAVTPPPPPVAAVPAAADGGIEDTTADLLRPMLRQWLSENMPRMVEKALSIELAESVKSNKKFAG